MKTVDKLSRPYRLIFAYGLYMNANQLKLCCPNAEFIDVGYVENCSLAFYGRTATWDSGRETFIHTPGAQMWGVVFKLNFSEAYRLDTWVDVRMDGAGEYFHYPMDVVGLTGKSYYALLYKKNILGDKRMASTEYLNKIREGASQFGIPQEYIQRLNNISNKKASYAVPRRGKFDRSLLLDLDEECGECGDLRASHGGPGFDVGNTA